MAACALRPAADPDGALAEAPGQRLPESWPAAVEQLAGAVREGLAMLLSAGSVSAPK